MLPCVSHECRRPSAAVVNHVGSTAGGRYCDTLRRYAAMVRTWVSRRLASGTQRNDSPHLERDRICLCGVRLELLDTGLHVVPLGLAESIRDRQ